VPLSAVNHSHEQIRQEVMTGGKAMTDNDHQGRNSLTAGAVPVVFGPPDAYGKWVRCANQVVERIADGTYKPGEWLPSARRLAAELDITPPIVFQAFSELCAKGIISRVEGKGYYAGNGEPPSEKPPKVHRAKGYAGEHDAVQDGQPGEQRQDLLKEKYITVSEFASMIRVSKMTVYRCIESGEIEGVRIGENAIRIIASSARAYLERNLFGKEEAASATAAEESFPEQSDGAGDGLQNLLLDPILYGNMSGLIWKKSLTVLTQRQISSGSWTRGRTMPLSGTGRARQ
jgi:excisionase family DNA binding protein